MLTTTALPRNTARTTRKPVSSTILGITLNVCRNLTNTREGLRPTDIAHYVAQDTVVSISGSEESVEESIEETTTSDDELPAYYQEGTVADQADEDDERQSQIAELEAQLAALRADLPR